MRQQDRARLAFEHVSRFEGKPPSDSTKKKYGVHCMKTPMMLKTAGLVQTLEFLASRSESDNGAPQLLKDLAEQLKRVDARIGTAETLRKQAREAPLQDYLLLARELDACLLWYRRFAQSILKVEPTDEAGGKQ
jgi:CRISPR-associated protein Cmr5